MTLTRTIMQTSCDVSELLLSSVFRPLHVISRKTYNLDSSHDGERCIIVLQIGIQVSILCPRADYRHQMAKTIRVPIHRQNIYMLESRARSEFTSYPLQNGNLWCNQGVQTFIRPLTLVFFCIASPAKSEVYTRNDFTATCPTSHK